MKKKDTKINKENNKNSNNTIAFKHELISKDRNQSKKKNFKLNY